MQERAEENPKKLDALDGREKTLRQAEERLKHDRELLDIDRQAFETARGQFADYEREARSKIAQERETMLHSLGEERDNMALREQELQKERQRLMKQQAEAKAQFVEQQNEAFREVFERYHQELDRHQKQLDEFEQQLAVKGQTLAEREGEVARRELAVTEREQKAEAGFADQVAAMAAEAKRHHEANVAEEARLKALDEKLVIRERQLEQDRKELCDRESELRKAEDVRDAGFAQQRNELEQELQTKRTKSMEELNQQRRTVAAECERRRNELEAELLEVRKQRLEEVSQELTRLRKERLAGVESEANAASEHLETELNSKRNAWIQERDREKAALKQQQELQNQKAGELSAQEKTLAEEKAAIEHERERLKTLEQRQNSRLEARSHKLDGELQELLAERVKTFTSQLAQYREENEQLRQGLRSQAALLAATDELKRLLGDRAPEEILRDLNAKTDELTRLKEELATCPTKEMRDRYNELDHENTSLKSQLEKLREQRVADEETLRNVHQLSLRNSELEAENRTLEKRAQLFEGAANEANEELRRLRAAYDKPVEVEKRHQEIEKPHISMSEGANQAKPVEKLDELKWLKGVGDACDRYGLHFNPRILKAFHTSLKTAEWSPLTVLAGVSGTGKSELPRLYSHFGGLYFTPLSVQPNWDSQESMLGFFNSIDNRFDAQPVLNFLAQSQKEWQEDYPGLRDSVCMVLLDEMNLAHPELYFAEFLSKLELRRGMKGNHIPTLPVKIGSGLKPYQLHLGRNVLWTGTMNQDETTKSLSDKVLDRAIMLFFPRPTELKRRRQLLPLDETNRGRLLHISNWNSWMSRIDDGSGHSRLGSNLTEEEVAPFKKFIEEMNGYLGEVGRAIGHRVWQSVEYYMANYPEVRVIKSRPVAEQDKRQLKKYLHLAFEDQLVQKVMPKLRGIDTRGDSKTKCLDKIGAQLNMGIDGESFNLMEDFNLACELGYGQFMWQSANYLKDEMTQEDVGEDRQSNIGEMDDDRWVPDTQKTERAVEFQDETPRKEIKTDVSKASRRTRAEDVAPHPEVEPQAEQSATDGGFSFRGLFRRKSQVDDTNQQDMKQLGKESETQQKEETASVPDRQARFDGEAEPLSVDEEDIPIPGWFRENQTNRELLWKSLPIEKKKDYIKKFGN